MKRPTCKLVIAALMHLAREQLEPDDGVDDDDEDDQQRDVKQRHHGFQDRVQYDLKT